MKKFFFIVLLITCTFIINAQERSPLKGRVMVGDAGLNNIFVINTTASIETKTDAAGNFTISAQPGDALVIYSPNITNREFVLKEASFENQPLMITVNMQAYELDEVVMDKDRSIDEVSLGIVPKDQKQYTVAERRVFAATTGLLDPLLNAISGRTKMLKKEMETEGKQQMLDDLRYICTEEQIIEEMKIPKEYVEGFLYYAIENPEFSQALKNNNKSKARFLMNGIAEQYLKVLKDE
ncbi:hypothetical protein E0W68_10395 [Flavobacterium salilacus subsp. salilacus]|uniref:hypothetical protein n=1 Tax=Flavobacterium TaxID=237 RepID=UPI0010757CB8|nr:MULTISPECIES: hypothetical protein [Flavobacterium]KAF2518139.1 hypothetical protein E0W68_10395 [Flavobacterium salilacus subsp. salilacus]MBE1615551.1 hypothetical protein [Flavobacterium sp. SaA2.13]